MQAACASRGAGVVRCSDLLGAIAMPFVSVNQFTLSAWQQSYFNRFIPSMTGEVHAMSMMLREPRGVSPSHVENCSFTDFPKTFVFNASLWELRNVNFASAKVDSDVRHR